MAITSIDNATDSSNKGIAKTIDEGSKMMMFDILQGSIYTTPEASTVRELASNAIDAVREKNVAISIINGSSKVEDYYINRDGDRYKDSNWNPNYYSLDWLNLTDHITKINYIEGTDTGFCDSFEVLDPGVGLSQDRLRLILRLGGSTKRNSKHVLGAFGLGNKAGLSVADYYTIESAHNGIKIKVQVYKYKTDSVTPKFDSDGNENDFFFFDEERKYKIYYEKTTDKNYTKVTVPCKKHHRDKFQRAVKSQLLYFDNLEYYITRENGYVETVNFRANILYNSKNILISDNREYSKPHLIVVKDSDEGNSFGVCYGNIAFRELELEDLYGNIGIKVPIRSVIRDESTGEEQILQHGIDVTPSRESVIWNDNTRNYVLKVFENAKEEAAQIVEKDLDEKDFLKWLAKAQSVFSMSGQSNNTLSRIKSIVDVNSIEPRYQKDKELKYSLSLFDKLDVRKVSKTYSKGKEDIDRMHIDSLYQISTDNVYLKYDTDETDRLKEFYLLYTKGPSFNTISIKDREVYLEKALTDAKDAIDREKAKDPGIDADARLKVSTTYIEEAFAKRDKVIALLEGSAGVKKYSDIVVDEEWKKNFLAKESKTEEEVQTQVYMSAEERRKLEQKVLVNVPSYNYRRKYDKTTEPIIWTRQEYKIQELIDLNSDKTIIYGFEENRDLLNNLAMMLCNTEHDRRSDPVIIIKVSKQIQKIMKPFTHVKDAIQKLNDKNEMVAQDSVRKWYTAKLIEDALPKLEYLQNFKTFNTDVVELYETLCEYHNTYYSSCIQAYANEEVAENDILTILSSMKEMQLFVNEHQGNTEAIANKSTEIFGSNIVTNGLGVDLPIYQKLMFLLDLSEPVGDLFNHVSFLIRDGASITREQECIIKDILELKEISFDIPDEIKNSVSSIQEIISDKELVAEDMDEVEEIDIDF